MEQKNLACLFPFLKVNKLADVMELVQPLDKWKQGWADEGYFITCFPR